MYENNLIGNTYGKLTVTGEGGYYKDMPAGNMIPIWKCKCECGRTNIDILETELLSGHVIHCGCENTINAKEMIGFVSGDLVVIERAPDRVYSNKKDAMWICMCNRCNRITKPILGSSLRKHHTRSCGCKIIDSSYIHGGKKERLYAIYNGMKERCENPNSKSYKNYGGRGISIDESFNTYEKFRDWALSNGYNPNAEKYECTINRIDNNGNYSADNCNFVGPKSQANNRTSNVCIEYQGNTYTISQFADKIGLEYYIVYSRYKHGWDIDKIANTPVLENEDSVEYNGKLYTYKELSNMSGIPSNTIYERIARRGWDIKRAITENVRNTSNICYSNNDTIPIGGSNSTIENWSYVSGIDIDTIKKRLSCGWEPEKAIFTPTENRLVNAIYFVDQNGEPIPM